MRLTTWNVNGIRNPFSYAPWNIKRTFPAMFDLLESDIVVMQELKIQRKDLKDDMVLLEGWDCFFSLPRQKKGYSGVGVYTRNATCAPVRAEEGVLGALPSPSGVPYRDCPENESIGGYPSSLQIAGLGVDGAALDAEGRCVVLEFPAFVLLGVYAPANSNGMRDDFRHAFHIALDFRIRNLDRLGKRVVLVGDLNVSRDERDTAAAVENCRKAGITHEDYISTPNRRIFNQLLLGGEVVGDRDEKRQQPVLWDTTRGFHPERLGMFTHWEQKTNARPGNHGSRIDFILVSACMRNWVVGANIQEGLLGSDHCPVFIDLADKVQIDGHEVYTKDILNPCGLFDHGVRRRDWQTLGTPAFSARKLPEFTRRQNIKSMFSSAGLKKKSSLSEPEQQTARPNHHVPASEPFSQGGNSAPDNLKTDASISATTPALKKRKISAVAHSPNKRHQSRTISSLLKAQSSLKGFFQPKDAGPLDPGKEGLSTKTDPCGDGAMKSTTAVPLLHTPGDTKVKDFVEPQSATATAGFKTSTNVSPATRPASMPKAVSPSQVSAQFDAQEQSQRSWAVLFSAPQPPMCEEHQEPCISMQTKKKGSNQGRSFWMCARPLGPSGQKERGTEWRCGTFVWCSDWSGKDSEGDS